MGRPSWTGVIGMDDVGMVQLTEDLDFAVEACDYFGIGQQFLTNKFESHDAIHLLVPGFEDLTGAAFAEALQKNVRTNQQLGPSPLQQLIYLIWRKPAAPQEITSQGTRLRKARQDIAADFLQLFGTNDLMATQLLD